ncbi:hypothetical protein [Streptomyces geranii]|uniref:hypothetical protein n=1 Tax=Streptomyces geranii TaxID=2058923 RepID=UPI0018E5065F|nr:hypothetical protein [Streptomyces geranii]
MLSVCSRVLMRLSPSVPPGRVSTLTLIFGFFASKSFASCLAAFRLSGALSTSSLIDVVALSFPLEEPSEPALHALSTSGRTATAATAALLLVRVIDLIVVPSFHASTESLTESFQTARCDISR